MKYHFFYFLVVSLFFNEICYSQNASDLNIGDNCPNLVLSSTNNSVQSFSFPYQNKVVLIFFWSSSVPKSKENIYKYKRLYSKYSDIGYKTCDGFDVISVALQSDKMVWEQDLKTFDLFKMNNCISTKGYNDFFIKAFKLSQTPTSFLVDEFGKIIFINPSIKTIIDYLDEKRNSEINTGVQTKIAGKIVFGKEKSPLANGKVWFLNEKRDTIQSVILDDKGGFALNNVNTSLSLTIYIFNTLKISEDQPVFLTSENGEIVSKFISNEVSFEYNLLDAEMPYLKPLFDNESIAKNETDKGLKDLYCSDILFKTKVSVLSKEAVIKLNTIVSKLKEDTKTRVEIISHTDSNGDDKLNSSLSLKQANSISAYLVLKGVSKSRINCIGKGETEILNKCKDGIVCSEEEHNLNRITEFKFYPLK